MRTLAHRWPDVIPVRGGLGKADPADSAAWADRLRRDRDRFVKNTTGALAEVAGEVERRARGLGAEALVLTGSTARGRRTAVSDLDFHVIGARPDVSDLPEELDIYADDAAVFTAKLRAGDDFVHWTVWYGCVLWDSGVVARGAVEIAETNAWPDVPRKREQARATLEFATKLVESGDEEAAREQVRGALSLSARYLILDCEQFPLARDELSHQLSALDHHELADALHQTIHADPGSADLARYIRVAQSVL